MTDFITTFLSSGLMGGVVGAAVGGLVQLWIGERFKNSIRHEYDKRIELHKAQLQATTAGVAERLIEPCLFKGELKSKLCSVEAGVQGWLLVFFANQRPMNGDVQVQQVVRDEVGQITIFGVVPNVFDWVEIRGIGRQPLEVEPIRMNVGDLTSGATMHIPAIPDQNGPPAQMTSKVPQKVDHVRRANVLFVNGKEEPQATPVGRDRHGTDDRESIVSVPCVREGRLSPRRPGSPQQRLQHEATFIDEHEWTIADARLFLSEANLAFAIDRPLARHAPVPSARASADSIPSRAEPSTRATRGRSRQSAAGSLRPPADKSTGWSGSRPPAGPSPKALRASASARLTTDKACQGGVWPPEPPLLPARWIPSSASRWTTRRLSNERPRQRYAPPEATSRRSFAEPPTPQRFLASSWIGQYVIPALSPIAMRDSIRANCRLSHWNTKSAFRDFMKKWPTLWRKCMASCGKSKQPLPTTSVQ